MNFVVLPSPSLFKSLSSLVELFLSVALADSLDSVIVAHVGPLTSRLEPDAAAHDCKLVVDGEGKVGRDSIMRELTPPPPPPRPPPTTTTTTISLRRCSARVESHVLFVVLLLYCLAKGRVGRDSIMRALKHTFVLRGVWLLGGRLWALGVT
jgi:hypothetical protein